MPLPLPAPGSAPVLCGTFIHLVMLSSWKVFSVGLLDGCLGVGGILFASTGQSLQIIVLTNWSGLHYIRDKSTLLSVNFTDNILNQQFRFHNISLQ